MAVSLDGDRSAAVKRRFLDLHRVMSIRDFLSGWFRGAPYEAVRRGNVEDFVAYGFYTRSMSQLPDTVRQARPLARPAFMCVVYGFYTRSMSQLPDTARPALSVHAPLRAQHAGVCGRRHGLEHLMHSDCRQAHACS